MSCIIHLNLTAQTADGKWHDCTTAIRAEFPPFPGMYIGTGRHLRVDEVCLSGTERQYATDNSGVSFLSKYLVTPCAYDSQGGYACAFEDAESLRKMLRNEAKGLLGTNERRVGSPVWNITPNEEKK